MEKKYQVFVSSTYEDLQEERKEVMRVLLQMDCIPSGMELFPAADEDTWTLVKGVIDDCDYYMVIIGGRYGSTDSDGMGFTEKEYQYAVDKGKPIIAFLHGDPDSIPQGDAEDTDVGKRKLSEFRDLVRRRFCKEWKNAHELGSVVVTSLTQLKKSHPGIGWVRGDQVLDSESAAEILRLRKQIDDLKTSSAPAGSERFAQGNDVFDVRVDVTCCDSESVIFPKHYKYGFSADSTWNDLFRTVSPLMIDESDEKSLKSALSTLFRAQSKESLLTSQYCDKEFVRCEIEDDCFHTILVQFRVLGLIDKSTRNRSVNDKRTYWALTRHGEMVMNRLRAISRPDTA